MGCMLCNYPNHQPRRSNDRFERNIADLVGANHATPNAEGWFGVGFPHSPAPERKGSKMQIHTQEHYEIIEAFERLKLGVRYDKEPKSLWLKSNIYQCGETNKLFIAFRHGYSAARCEYLHTAGSAA